VEEKFRVSHFVSRLVIDQNLGIDNARYLRMLAKRGYLVEKGLSGVLPGVQMAAWPPPDEFLHHGKPIGLVYYATKWCRFYLTDWIVWRMSELESKEGVMQLDQRTQVLSFFYSGDSNWDPTIPRADGLFTIASSGKSVATPSCIPVQHFLGVANPRADFMIMHWNAGMGPASSCIPVQHPMCLWST
jgi:hypothetical protein